MKLAISQPTFLPWPGYFSLITNVNEFIFLDNVQFNKRSWQQRNYISSYNKQHLLTIPVKTKGRFHQKLKDVEIDFENYDVKNILDKFNHSYKKENYFEKIFPDLENIFNYRHRYLVDLNIDLIKYICKFLNIKTNLIKSSSLKLDKNLKNIDLLNSISLYRNATEYITTEGSKIYLKDLKKFPKGEVSIKYFKFNLKNSNNINFEEGKFLSMIDLLFKEGQNCKSILAENYVKIDL